MLTVTFIIGIDTEFNIKPPFVLNTKATHIICHVNLLLYQKLVLRCVPTTTRNPVFINGVNRGELNFNNDYRKCRPKNIMHRSHEKQKKKKINVQNNKNIIIGN